MWVTSPAITRAVIRGNHGYQKSDVNYQPSRIDARMEDNRGRYSEKAITGNTQQKAIAKKQPFAQASVLYRSFSKQERANLISNLAGDLGKVSDSKTKHIMRLTETWNRWRTSPNR